MKLFTIKKSLVLALMLSTQLFSNNIQSDTDAIRAMGNGMSDMRNMLEMYALTGMKIKYKNPQKRLKEIIKTFDNTLNEVLARYAKDKTITDALNGSKNAWQTIKKAFKEMDSSKADEMKKNAMFVHSHMREVIKPLEQIKDYLAKNSDTKSVKELNAAIEIAASSQRLSSHYMMKTWRLDDPTIKEHWDKGVEKYKKSIAILKNSSYYNNEEFKSLLDRTEKALSFFEIIFDQESAIPALVDKNANKANKDAGIMVNIILGNKK